MWNRPPGDGDAPTLPDVRVPATAPAPRPAYVAPPARYTPARPAVRVSHKINQVIFLVTDVVEALLLLRVILIFLAADPTVFFAHLVYGLSAPLVAPFQGLFPEVVIAQGEIDLAAIIAMIAYAFAGRILQAVVQLVAHW